MFSGCTVQMPKRFERFGSRLAGDAVDRAAEWPLASLHQPAVSFLKTYPRTAGVGGPLPRVVLGNFLERRVAGFAGPYADDFDQVRDENFTVADLA